MQGEFKRRGEVVNHIKVFTGMHVICHCFTVSAKTIADIYKSRWDFELFFKWIKQNLKIKTFIRISENAVKIQIWTAVKNYTNYS